MKTQTTEKKPTHTATPWAVYDDSNLEYPNIEVEGGSEKICPEVYGEDHSQAVANAAFIVRCVNSHEALLEAARQGFQLIKEGGFTHPMTEEFYDETMKKLDDAIKQASEVK